MTFTAYYQLKNTKKDGLGVKLLNSIAGTFVVLEECSYERPREIARFGHNGTAGDRSNAFSCAMNRARSLQNYSGAMCDYNVYEETP
ncbi:hypothetical protein ABLU95_10885 [Klebsiella sp. GG_Kp146]|uniref:hypothetical protein n=1 Tax=Klebsiella sp. GG_Kp146 TaxID=3153457 RepID=UPI0032B31217